MINSSEPFMWNSLTMYFKCCVSDMDTISYVLVGSVMKLFMGTQFLYPFPLLFVSCFSADTHRKSSITYQNPSNQLTFSHVEALDHINGVNPNIVVYEQEFGVIK